MIPDKTLAAVCGLYCGACGIYLATQENDTAKIEYYAARLGQSIEETRCDGCRSERKSAWCRNNCSFTGCAEKEGVDFCGACNRFPCQDLKGFQASMPHRVEILEAQHRIAEAGWEKWMIEMQNLFACPDCSAPNTSYNLSCRKCGHKPGNEFVWSHHNEIVTFLQPK